MGSDERWHLSNVEGQPVTKDQNIFPKKVGIVFIEHIRLKHTQGRPRKTDQGNNLRLDFDQVACAHLILQMNTIQSIFEFQIVIPELIKEFSFEQLPYENNNNKNSQHKTKNSPMFDWFDNQVKIILSCSETPRHDIGYLRGIDYWIGITSKPITHDWSFEGQTPEDNTKSGKFIGIITSVDWEKIHSPPSLFEHIALSILLCSLYFINREFGGQLHFHSLLITKGCIFDFTDYTPHRRIDISNPYLCGTCRENLRKLETKIFDKHSTTARIHIYDDIHRILSRKWMGSPEKRDSPLYNLKKL